MFRPKKKHKKIQPYLANSTKVSGYTALQSGSLSLSKYTTDSINAHLDLMSNKTISPEKHSREEGWRSLPEGERPVY